MLCMMCCLYVDNFDDKYILSLLFSMLRRVAKLLITY